MKLTNQHSNTRNRPRAVALDRSLAILVATMFITMALMLQVLSNQ